jgi:hypothetical protein
MKALTVKQPWAYLIMRGLKDVENRTRQTKYRGPLAIHAAQKPSIAWTKRSEVGLSHLSQQDYDVAWLVREENWDAGCVLGVVDLIDCVRDSDSQWAFPDHWHLILANPRRVTIPIPATGRLGLWEWNEQGLLP